MSNYLGIYQSQYYNSQECKELIAHIEDKINFLDEIDLFKSLVNFSQAKKTPYQRMGKIS